MTTRQSHHDSSSFFRRFSLVLLSNRLILENNPSSSNTLPTTTISRWTRWFLSLASLSSPFTNERSLTRQERHHNNQKQLEMSFFYHADNNMHINLIVEPYATRSTIPIKVTNLFVRGLVCVYSPLLSLLLPLPPSSFCFFHSFSSLTITPQTRLDICFNPVDPNQSTCSISIVGQPAIDFNVEVSKTRRNATKRRTLRVIEPLSNPSLLIFSAWGLKS